MKRWFTNLYRKWRRKKERNVVVKPAKLPVTEKLKWGRVICHTSTAQGADTVRNDELITENAYCKKMYGFMKIFTPVGNRDIGGINGAYKHITDKGCTASIESHLNAFNSKAKGYEVLILKGDTTSREYGKKWLELMAKHFPDRVNRGIKEVVYGQGGYKNLKAARDKGCKVALLTESFFLDNDKEWIDEEKLAIVFDEFLGL